MSNILKSTIFFLTLIYSTLLFAIEKNDVLSHPLIEGYFSALNFDADYQTVLLDRNIAKENIAIARAGLLPIVSANYNRTNNNTDQKTISALSGVSNQSFNYPSTSKSVILQQPLLKGRAWFSYFQSTSQDQSAVYKLASGLQTLGMRVIQNYVDVYQYAQQLSLQNTQIKKYELWLNQNSKLLGAGLITRPQLEEVKTRLLVEKETLAEIKNNLFKSELVYEKSTGIKLINVQPLNYHNLNKFYYEYSTLATFLVDIQTQNPDLLVKKQDVESANYEIKKNLSDHLPVASIVASSSYSNSGQDLAIGKELKTNAVGVQVTIPIFSGGQTQAAVRQSILSREKIKSELVSLDRRVEIDASADYVALKNGLNKITALESHIKTMELKLIGIKKGRAAGVSTDLDVMNAEYDLHTAKFDLIKAISSAIVLYGKLYSYVGRLSDDIFLTLANRNDKNSAFK